MAFVAAYDVSDSGRYEKHVVRLARKWISIMASPLPTQGVVDKLLDEFSLPRPDDYGCAWDDLNKAVTALAGSEEWLASGGRDG